MARPSFAKLLANYPTGSAEEVKDTIGGKVDAEWITNTCVVRVSRGLNYAGAAHTIPMGQAGLLTVGGADHKRYALRVAEFIKFLKIRYGSAEISKSGAAISRAAFEGSKGIIVFHVEGWIDATGHFTLFDGKNPVYEGGHDYFGMPTVKPPVNDPQPWLKRVDLWACPA